MAIQKLLNIPFETNVLYEESSSSGGYGFGNVPTNTVTLQNGSTTTVIDADGVSVNGQKVDFPTGGGKFATSIIEKTWSELSAMKTDNALVPGQQYRITDYVATVGDVENAQSANHPFDLIVVADSPNTLNEKARAIKHVGDAYFPSSVKWEAWEVWYCLDNDASRFAWADTANGRGVVYRLIDEFQNDCPYDFKGIMFTRWAITDVTSDKLSALAINYLGQTFKMSELNDFRYSKSSIDFSIFTVDATSSMLYYTFSIKTSDSNEIVDASLSGYGNDVYGNKLGVTISNVMVRLLPENVFLGVCFNNVLGDGCFLNTFGPNCRYNVLKNGCQYNLFGKNCVSNILGVNCSNNIFGSGCVNNAFYAVYCSDNLLVDGSSHNVVSVDGYDRTASRSFENNVLGSYCCGNLFKNTCVGNTFGDNCSDNVLGGNCYSNKFGENCSNNVCEYDYRLNVLGDGCQENTFGKSCTSNVFGANCWRNTFGVDCNNNVFGKAYKVWSTWSKYRIGDIVKNSGSFYSCVLNYGGGFDPEATYNSNECVYYEDFESEEEIEGIFKLDNGYTPGMSWDSIAKTEVQFSDIFTTTSNPIQSHFRYVNFEDGVCYVALCRDDSLAASAHVQNISVAKGVMGDSINADLLQITVSVAGQQYKITYEAHGSQTIDVSTL